MVPARRLARSRRRHVCLHSFVRRRRSSTTSSGRSSMRRRERAATGIITTRPSATCSSSSTRPSTSSSTSWRVVISDMDSSCKRCRPGRTASGARRVAAAARDRPQLQCPVKARRSPSAPPATVARRTSSLLVAASLVVGRTLPDRVGP